MRVYQRILLVVLVVLGAAAAVIVLRAAPRIQSIEPNEGAELEGQDAVTIRFSRPLNRADALNALHIQSSAPGAAITGVAAWDEATNALRFTPNGGWPAGVEITVTLDSGVRAAAFPPLAQRGGGQWHFYTHAARLVFLFPNQGAANLYIYQSGRELQQITRLPGGVLDYTLLNQAAPPRLYYSLATPTGSEIYMLNLPGEAPQVTAAPPPTDAPLPPARLVQTCPQATCQALAISPDGRRLAYESVPVVTALEAQVISQVEYVLLSEDGAAAQAQPPLPETAGRQTMMPAWAHNHRLAIYDNTGKAYLLFDVSANQLLRRIPNDTGQPGDWQPDGSGFVAAQISYLSPNSPSGGLTGLERLADSHLLRYDAAGGERRDLTGEPGLEDAAPAFSPDGAQLAFARKSLSPRLWTPGRQLWVMRMADGSARPLTNDPLYTHFDFAWNPSSSQLAYVRFNQSVISEPPEVWIIDLNTGDSLRVIAGGYAPAWLP